MKNQLLWVFSLLLSLCVGCNTVIKPQPIPPAGSVISFTATPGELAAPGENVTLSWATQNATSVSLEHVGQGPVTIDPKAASGSVEVTLTKDALFVLTARGEGGTDASPTAVRVTGSPLEVVFDAVPRVVPAGGYSTLVWSAPIGTTVTVKEVGGAMLDLGGQKDSGSVRVEPRQSTSYELDANGQKFTVAVEVGIAIHGFELSGPAPLPGQMATITWETSGSSKLTLTREGAAEVLLTETNQTNIASGTFTDLIPATTLVDGLIRYQLELEQGPLKVSRGLTVRASGSTKIDHFIVPDYAKPLGSFAAQWKTAGAERLELWVNDQLVYVAPDALTVREGNRSIQAGAAGSVKVKVVASNSRGATAFRERTTRVVGDVSIGSFTVASSTIATGGTPVTFNWMAPNARRMRIVGSDGHTIATMRGTAAETGTATAFPNRATLYTLEVDNTLDAAITSTQAVAVTAPATFAPAVPSLVVVGNPVEVGWAVGTHALVFGAPHTAVDTRQGSMGFGDISTTGAQVKFASADDAVQTFTPPDFESFLYGNRVSGQVTVSTNGFFVFGSLALSRPGANLIPNSTVERNFVAPYWADLELAAKGTVYWELVGEAPDRVLVVQFDKVKVVGDPLSELTFQARVHQTGVVTFEYQTLNATELPAATIGVQGDRDGLSTTGAAANVALTFFGPKPAPVTLSTNSLNQMAGFIKLSGGYLKGVYSPPTFVDVNDVRISEVLFEPNAAIATTGEWFEVSNRANGPVDLNGWTIAFPGGSSHTIASSVIVAANTSIVLGQSSSGPANDDVATAYQYGTTFSMSEPRGVLALRMGNYLTTASWNSTLAGHGGTGVSAAFELQSFLLSTDISTTAPHGIRCNSTQTFGSQTPLQKGSPGIAPRCFSYLMQSIPVSYLDISATGVITTTGDDAIGALDLTTAPFTFFGMPQTTVSVSTNGFLRFKPTTNAGLTNRSVPSTTAANGATAAVFWDNLDSSAIAGSSVYSKRIAANADPSNPSAHWVVQWHKYEHIAANDALDFQIKLFDSGVIEYHYAAMVSGNSVNYASGNSATVWLENPAGTAALVSSVNKPWVIPMSAIRFTPN